jgi:hypothetical protein
MLIKRILSTTKEADRQMTIHQLMGPDLDRTDTSLIALRRQLPEAPRAYRLPLARFWCPSAFVLATWAISWCGTSALRGASLIVLVPAALFALADRQHLRQGWWWFLYLGGIVAITALPLGLVAQLVTLAAWALLVCPLATGSRLAQAYPGAQYQPIASPQ